MSAWSAVKRAYAVCRERAAAHVHAADRLATLSNTGATIIWTHLPFYPLLVWYAVGRPFWPAFVIFVTWPLFFAVPAVSRLHPKTARALFVVAGVANTLLSVKAFGTPSAVGWFLLPCLLIAATFFRLSEWKLSGALSLLCGAAALLVPRLGAPLHAYTPPQYREFAILNYWCVGCLAAYLLWIAARQQLAMRERNP